MNLRTYNTIMHALTAKINLLACLGSTEAEQAMRDARRIVADIARQESEDATPESVIENQNASRDAWNAQQIAQNADEIPELDARIADFLRDCISRGACE